MERTSYVLLPDGVFLPDDHGPDFDITLSGNSINQWSISVYNTYGRTTLVVPRCIVYLY